MELVESRKDPNGFRRTQERPKWWSKRFYSGLSLGWNLKVLERSKVELKGSRKDHGGRMRDVHY